MGKTPFVKSDMRHWDPLSMAPPMNPHAQNLDKNIIIRAPNLFNFMILGIDVLLDL